MQLKVITSFVTGETVFAILHTGIVFAVPVYLITSPTSGVTKNRYLFSPSFTRTSR